MKKVLIVAVALGGFFTTQHIAANHNPMPETQVTQEKEYKKIAPEEVNKEALMNIKSKYGDYQIVEAGVAADGEYKLVLKKENASITALFTSAGDLIKIL